MTSGEKSMRILLAALSAAAILVTMASAAVPSNYLGRPYPSGSAPKEIPGKIIFHDYDLGGRGMAWVQDDIAFDPISGGCTAGGRENDGDAQHPAMTMTNHESDTKFDTFYNTGVTFPNGVRYPSPDTSFAANDWYIGACHWNNWFNVTVHVSKPGRYWISSIWGASNTYIDYQIYFIGTQYAATKDTVKTDTVKLFGCTGYHAWRKYADFASIQLDSGVQVMKFYNESYHLNQDFLYFAADSNAFQFPTGIEQPTSKVPGKAQSNLSIDRGIVRFAVPDAGKTNISVYDCLGREMQNVLDRNMAAGSHSVAVNTTGLRKGVYFVRMEHAGVNSVTKFQVMRQ